VLAKNGMVIIAKNMGNIVKVVEVVVIQEHKDLQEHKELPEHKEI
jgi:hypothetical protein